MKSCYICKIKKDLTEFYKDKSRSSGVSSRCKKCANIIKREKKKLKMKSDPEYKKLVNKKKEKRNYNREKRDPIYKLKRKMRHSLRDAFRRRGYNKQTQSYKILKGEWEVVKNHFESLFKDGMTWENMGEWHIDHITPLSVAKNEEDIIKLCHYKNLQPLWAKDNLEKADKVL